MKERDLPLTALRTFAVAARAESQSAAARQLGVTHDAVSKQIGALNKEIQQYEIHHQTQSPLQEEPA